MHPKQASRPSLVSTLVQVLQLGMLCFGVSVTQGLSKLYQLGMSLFCADSFVQPWLD